MKMFEYKLNSNEDQIRTYENKNIIKKITFNLISFCF